MLDKHTNKIHIKGIKCDICGKGFGQLYYLNRHVERVHEKGEKSFNNCHHCEKKFKLKVDLKKTHS